jgi:hypothetical protein
MVVQQQLQSRSGVKGLDANHWMMVLLLPPLLQQ